MTCHTMPCYGMLCYAMLSHAMLSVSSNSMQQALELYFQCCAIETNVEVNGCLCHMMIICSTGVS